MVLHWRRCGRAGGCQILKENKLKSFIYIQTYLDGHGMSTMPRRKDELTQSAGKCCCDNWFDQWFKIKRDFGFKWLMKQAVTKKTYLENRIQKKYPINNEKSNRRMTDTGDGCLHTEDCRWQPGDIRRISRTSELAHECRVRITLLIKQDIRG